MDNSKDTITAVTQMAPPPGNIWDSLSKKGGGAVFGRAIENFRIVPGGGGIGVWRYMRILVRRPPLVGSRGRHLSAEVGSWLVALRASMAGT